MANDREPQSAGGENPVEMNDFNFDEFFTQEANSEANSGATFLAGGDASEVPNDFGVASTPVAEAFDSSIFDTTAHEGSTTEMVQDAATDTIDAPSAPDENAPEEGSESGKTEKDAVPPEDDDAITEVAPLDAALIFLNRRWLAVACLWGGFLLTTNIVAAVAPPAKTSSMSLGLYLVLFNLFGGAGIAAPLTLWRTPNKDEKTSIANIALCLALMAVVVAAAILLTEFFRYDFSLKR